MKHSPGDSLGCYRILAPLGAGGMGEVYLAEDTRLSRRVAVKILPDSLLQDRDRRARFLREARAAAAVDHPNVVHIYEVVEEPGGLIYLVMQHVEGRTLRQLLAAGKLDLDRGLAVAAEITDALAAAHARGIVHRDIKPENLMIDASGHARLLDFGLARALHEPAPGLEASAIETEVKLTSPGVVMGTAAYMSPEQARGEEADARTDIFSLGVTLYEAITGRYPFAGRTSVETTDALLHRDPEPVSAIAPAATPAVDWIFSKMLAKDREERYQSAREIVVDLRKIQRSTPGSGSMVGGARPPRRRWAVVAAAGVVVAALAAWLAWWPADGPGRSAAPPRPTAGGPMRLAVLPFHNVRNDPRIDFLGFALADALISKLAYVQSLTVRPSSFVERYREKAPDPKQAGQDLSVDHLLTGSLLAEGSTLRLSVQFVDLAEGAVRWQDTMDASLENLLSLQDKVVDRIVGGMKLTLSPEETSRLARDVSRDSRAYDLTLRALALPETVDGNQRAVEMLEQALGRDPLFALAWSELADRQYRLGLYGAGFQRYYEESEESARRALEINPDLPRALRSIAVLLTEQGRHEEAYAQVRRWLEVNPSDAEAHFARSYVLRYTGLLDEAAKEFERALELSPGNPGFRSGTTIYQLTGNADRADEIASMDEGSSWSLAAQVRNALLRGDTRRARELAERCMATDPNSVHAGFARTVIVALDGDRSQAAAMVRTTSPSDIPDSEVLYSTGAFLSWLGDTETALDFLKRAVAGGYYCYPGFRNDPRLENVRARPEFAALLEEVRGKHEEFKRFVAANP